MQKLEKRNNMVGGIVLIAIGLFALLVQVVDLGESLGWLILPGLGVIFLAWGIVSREAGPMIPGGILSGLGLGVYLVSNNMFAIDDGAVFMFAFAAGWALITLMTAVFTRETHWWPLIPGAIMALVGAVVLGVPFTETALEWIGRLWPLALIIGGLFILFGRDRAKG